MLYLEQNTNDTYTSFELMKIFNIKKGSWNYIKNKFDLDNFSESIIEDGKTKFLYNEQAYNILKNYYSGQVIEEIKENPKMLLLAQENTILKNTLEEYKKINIKFENMYLEEKDRNESFIECNTELKTQNNYLLEENKKMQEELEKLKNRNFFERLFNKY